MSASPGQSPVERRVQEIWEQLLNVAPVGAHDSLVELGADPALLAQGLETIRAAFGLLAEGLPVSEIGTRPTVAAMSRLIEDNAQPPSALVVCLQPRGKERPLFLIHAGGGYVFFYRALAARLAPDRPVFALRAEASDDGLGHPFHRFGSMEEVAARYLALVMSVQPDGPYSLGGGSFGGTVAFEMARQLRAQGQRCDPVLLFSAFVRNDANPEAAASGIVGVGPAPLRHRGKSHLSHASTLPAGDAVRYVSEKIRSNKSEVLGLLRGVGGGLRDASSRAHDIVRRRGRTNGEPVPPDLMYRCAANLKTGNRLLSMYTPSSYDGPIVLFRAMADKDPVPHWSGLATGGMSVHDMPGGHLTMLEEPGVGATAALVRRYLAT